MTEAVELSTARPRGGGDDPRALTVIEPPPCRQLVGGRSPSCRVTPTCLSLTRTVSKSDKQSLLGPAWAICQPLAMMLVFAVVFTIRCRPADTVPGVRLFRPASWTAFAAAVGSASTSLVAHAGLVTRVFPARNPAGHLHRIGDLRSPSPPPSCWR